MTDIVEYPEWVMLRDTMLHDDMGGLGQRIYTSAGSGYTKQKYIRADVVEALRQQLAVAAKTCAEMLSEQDYEYNRKTNAIIERHAKQLAEDDRLLRASVPDRWKTCTSPVGAVQSYIAELEQQLAECLAALEKISEVDPSNSWSCQSGMAKEALAMAKELE